METIIEVPEAEVEIDRPTVRRNARSFFATETNFRNQSFESEMRRRLAGEVMELAMAWTDSEVLDEAADVIHFVDGVLSSRGVSLDTALSYMAWKRSNRDKCGKNKSVELRVAQVMMKDNQPGPAPVHLYCEEH